MCTRTCILNNMILYEKKISILIVIADHRGFIQTIQSYYATDLPKFHAQSSRAAYLGRIFDVFIQAYT